METLPHSTGRHRSSSAGAVVWPGNLSPEERRVHQVLAEVREGLDTARLAEATGLTKIALYPVLENLRLRGLVEAYPGSPVLFYISEGRKEAPMPEARSGAGVRAAPMVERPQLLISPAATPWRVQSLPPLPGEAPEPEPGSLYLVWETRPQRSIAGYRSLVRRGAPGLLITRSPLGPRPSRSETETGWVGGLAPSEPGARLFLGETGPPPRAERLDEVVRAVRQAGPGAAVLLDGLEYLVAKHGFDSVLRMVYHLRELAAVQGAVLLVPVDPRVLEPRQMALLERESKV